MRWLAFLLPAAVYAAVLVIGLEVAGGKPADTDAYSRLNRVRALHGDRPARPNEVVSHWTLPLDALLLAGVAGGVPLERAGYWIGPVLLACALAALAWAAWPLLAFEHVLLALVLFPLRPAIFAYFGPGRADHHSLLVLLFILAFGCGVRIALRPYDRNLCVAAGVLHALLIWVSVEGIALLFAHLAALAWFWIRAPEDFARKGRTLCLALLAGLVVAVAAERGWDVAQDRVSFAHVLLALLLAGLGGAAHGWAPARRLPLALAGAAAAGGMLLLFGGPHADVDPRALAVWERNVLENQPLLAGAAPELMLRLQSLPGLLLPLWFLRRGFPHRGWVFLAVALFLLLPLFFLRIRWAGYTEVLLVVCQAELLFRLLGSIHRRWRGVARAALSTVAVVALVFAGFLAALAAPPEPDDGRGCPLADLAAALHPEPPRLILTEIDHGPELLFRTRHRVVATPYHRDAPGILAAYDAFHDEAAARDVVRRLAVDWVLVCPGAGDHGPFHARLARGDAPAWLAPRPLRSTLATHFRLYEVR